MSAISIATLTAKRDELTAEQAMLTSAVAMFDAASTGMTTEQKLQAVQAVAFAFFSILGNPQQLATLSAQGVRQAYAEGAFRARLVELAAEIEDVGDALTRLQAEAA